MSIIKSSATPDVNNVLCVSRKHWLAYVFHSILFIIGLFLLDGNRFWYIVGLVFILVAAVRILANLFVKWTLTETELILEEGFLPWAKTYLEIPFYDIFEAYYRPSFLGHIFGYGHLTIRRSEGTTSTFSTTHMRRHKELTTGINTFVKKSKSKEIPITNVNTQINITITDELIKLHNLKEKGILTADEFFKHKNRLLSD